MFKRTRNMSAIAMAMLFSFASGVSAANQAPLERWRSYTGVTWNTPEKEETPTRLTRPSQASTLMQREEPLSVPLDWFQPVHPRR
jgi:hypothetical protein